MKRFALGGLTALALLAGLAPPAATQMQVKLGEAADFPPGRFTDGNKYSLADLRGKVVVLYFFEKQ
jgi:cytochrome oxidase Cu insertion factor (SCO1/SenC/PrrC family)